MVKALTLRELVKPGLLLDHSLRSLNNCSCGSSRLWFPHQLPWADTDWYNTRELQWAGAELERTR